MLSWKEDSIKRIETGRQGCKVGENRRKEQNEEQKEKNKRNNEKPISTVIVTEEAF